MKSLCNDQTGRYTTEGVILSRRFSAVLKPIFKEYRAMGYSVREICHIAFHEIIGQESQIILSETCARVKAKQKEEI